MIKKTIFFTIILITNLFNVNAQAVKNNYTIKLGYNIGAISPINIPASIREINNYRIKPNFIIGFSFNKMISTKWGYEIGVDVENKDMQTSVRAKGYKMNFSLGNNYMNGYYTGNIFTLIKERMFSIPINFNYSLTDNWKLKLGGYISYLYNKKFSGYAYEGYVRVGNPTGMRINIGTTPKTRGNFNYSSDMKSCQYGVSVGTNYSYNNQWGTFLVLNWGLSNIYNNNLKVFYDKLYPIFCSIGIYYSI